MTGDDIFDEAVRVANEIRKERAYDNGFHDGYFNNINKNPYSETILKNQYDFGYRQGYAKWKQEEDWYFEEHGEN